MKKHQYIYQFILTFILFTTPLLLKSQNDPIVLINEIGLFDQGGYIELLVVGDLQRNDKTVNISNFVIDNNTPVASNDAGQIQIGNCLNELDPGTLILIYDDSAPHPQINPQNDGTPNSYGIYQIPFSSPCLIKCSSDDSYRCTDVLNGTTQWDQILPINADSDAVQLRNDFKKIEHAYNWAGEDFADASYPNTVNIRRPANVNDVVLGLGGVGGNPCNTLDIVIGPQGGATPGDSNEPGNGDVINEIETGNFPQALQFSCGETVPVAPGQEGYIEVVVEYGKAPYTINWSGPSSGTESLSDPGFHTIDSLLSAGLYTITVTDTKGCSKTCESILTNETEEDATCNGGCKEIGKELDLTQVCILWLPTEGLENPQSPITNACPEESTLYTMVVTDQNGNYKEEYSYYIKVETSTLTINSNGNQLNGDFLFCNNYQLKLFAESGFDSYEWFDEEMNSIGNGLQYNVSKPGQYTVHAEEANGCKSIKTAKVKPWFDLNIYPQDPILCSDGSQAIELSVNPGYDFYEWTGPNDFSQSGENLYTINISTLGNYSVTATLNSAFGCTLSDKVEIKDESPESLENKLQKEGFHCIPIEFIRTVGAIEGPKATNRGGGLHIFDYSDAEIKVEDRITMVGDYFQEVLLCTSQESSIEVFITSDANYCESDPATGKNINEQADDLFELSKADIAFRVHVLNFDGAEDLLCIDIKKDDRFGDCEEDPDLLDTRVYRPFTYDVMKSLNAPLMAWLREEYPGKNEVYYKRQIGSWQGRRFEEAALLSIGIEKNKYKFNNSIPDAVVSYISTGYFGTKSCIFHYKKDGILVDAKTDQHNKVFYRQSGPRRYQIQNYIDYLADSDHSKDGGVPGILFIVPAGTEIEEKILTEARFKNIAVYKMEVYHEIHNPYRIIVGRACMLNDPIYTDGFNSVAPVHEYAWPGVWRVGRGFHNGKWINLKIERNPVTLEFEQ